MKPLFRIVRERLFSRLSVKVALLLLIFAVLPLVVSGYVYLTQFGRGFTETVQDTYKEIAKGYGARITQLLETPYMILKSHTALMATLVHDPDRERIVLVKLTLDYPVFDEIVLTDKNGTVLATSSLDTTNVRKDARYSRAYLSAIDGKEYVSSLYVGNNYIPYIDIALPYKVLNQIEGVIIARINVSNLWSVVDEIRIGKTGRAFMITDAGRIIAHADKKLVFREEKVSPALFARLSGSTRSGYFEYRETPQSKTKVVYYSHLKEFKWIFAIEQDASEVYYYHNLARRFAGGAVILVLMGIGIMSLLVAHWVTRPLKKMAAAMRRVGRGDYNVAFVPRSTDEIGRLMISFNRMIDKVKKAEEQERLAAFGNAAANIAHKLKNSIVSIKTHIQLFARRRHDPEFVSRMQAALEYEIAYIENVLSRFSSFRKQQQEEPVLVSLRDVIGRIVDGKKECCREKDITIRLACGDATLPVYGDEMEIREVFINIINNACEALPEGGSITIVGSEQATIKKVKHERSACKIAVHDTGCGIPPDIIDTVFTPFQTTKRYGMGIGLAYCKQVVSHYQGQITIDSVPGEGTTVTVVLPKGYNGVANEKENDEERGE